MVGHCKGKGRYGLSVVIGRGLNLTLGGRLLRGGGHVAPVGYEVLELYPQALRQERKRCRNLFNVGPTRQGGWWSGGQCNSGACIGEGPAASGSYVNPW